MGTSNQQPATSLWPDNFKIGVIGGTGEHASGKTMFGMTIDPTRTIMVDLEKSGEMYHASLGIKRYLDAPAEMLNRFPQGYKPIQVFEWFRDTIRLLKPGEFTVLIVDPISDVESGLADWVEAHPAFFGHTANQYQKMEGVFWSDVKELWKTLLLDMASRVETFYFTSHLRTKYVGGRPTSQKEARGKATLNEIAGLYLHFERKPDKKGNVPGAPSATILKNRLSKAFLDPDGAPVVVPILPPRLPVATPAAIREYIKNPADYEKLKPGERLGEEVFTEREQLEIKERISENGRLMAEADTRRFELAANAAASVKKYAWGGQIGTISGGSEAVNEAIVSNIEIPATPAEEAPPVSLPSADPEISITDQIKSLWLGDLKRTPEKLKEVLAAQGFSKLADLPVEQAAALRDRLLTVRDNERVEAERLANVEVPEGNPF